jgi:hypothetical protein
MDGNENTLPCTVATINSFIFEKERRNRIPILSLTIVRLFRKPQDRMDVHSSIALFELTKFRSAPDEKVPR